MKSLFLAIATILAFATTAEAKPCGDMVCHNNPTCQRLRNAGNCARAAAALSAPGGYSRSDNQGVRREGMDGRNRGQPGGSGARY